MRRIPVESIRGTKGGEFAPMFDIGTGSTLALNPIHMDVRATLRMDVARDLVELLKTSRSPHLRELADFWQEGLR